MYNILILFAWILLGMGDWSGFMDKIQDVVPMDQQPELLQKLSEGSFTLRIMYEQFQNILKMGPLNQVSWKTTQESVIFDSMHLSLFLISNFSWFCS